MATSRTTRVSQVTNQEKSYGIKSENETRNKNVSLAELIM